MNNKLYLLSEQHNYAAGSSFNYLPILKKRPEFNISNLPKEIPCSSKITLIGAFENAQKHPAFDLNIENSKVFYDSFYSLKEVKESILNINPDWIILNLALEAAQNPLKLIGTLKAILANNPTLKIYWIENLTYNLSSIYRHWSKAEMQTFSNLLGLKTEAANSGIIISYDKDFEQSVSLELFGFPIITEKINSLILTNEYAPAKRSGGIGTSMENRHLQIKDRNLLVYLDECKNAADLQILAADSFYIPKTTLDPAALAYRASQLLSAFFYNLRLLQFHDFMGIGYLLAQATKTAELPLHVQTHASLNGNHLYVEQSSSYWSFFIHEDIPVKEKISIELADKILAPTEFITKLYRNSGIKLADEKLKVMPFPYSFPSIKKQTRTKICRLIFFGRFCEMKGFHDFTNAAISICQQNNIKEIYIIGAQPKTPDNYQVLKSLVTVKEFDLAHSDALKLLQEIGPSSLLLLPNKGENFGNVLLEAIAIQLPFIAYRGNGFIEIIPEHSLELLTCKPNTEALVGKALELLELEPALLASQMESLYQDIKNSYQLINKHWQEINLSPQVASKNIKLFKTEITLSILVYKSDFEILKQCLETVNNQVLAPLEVIIIDDHSGSEYHQLLQDLIKTNLKIPFRIYYNESNLGCAASRNLALTYCQTKYLINLDSDDLAFPNFTLKLLEGIEHSKAAAVCGFYPRINVSDNLTQVEIQSCFKTLGDGIIANIKRNNLFCSMGIWNREEIQSCGELEGALNELGEDFRLAAKLISNGRQIVVTPVEIGFYRFNNNSLTAKVKNFPGDLKTAKQLNNLPIFERIRLMSVIQTSWDLHSEYLKARSIIDELYDQQANDKNRIRHLEYESKILVRIKRLLKKLLKRFLLKPDL